MDKSALATEAARYERLSKQVGDRELSHYYEGKASAIRKQLETRAIMDTPQIERAMRTFLGELRKAGIQVSEIQSTVYPDRVDIVAQ